MSSQSKIMPSDVDMSVSIAGVKLANPMMTASGTCGYSDEYSPYTDLSCLGAFVTKSITVSERKGNEPPRVVETIGGMLNAIGLANVGLERFIDEKIPSIRKLGVPVFVNVAGHSIEDYVAVCERLSTYEEFSGFELNVSCPNVSDGMFFGTNPKLLADLVVSVKKSIRKGILIVKLSPNVTDICEMAEAAIDGGADALSMINTLIGMAININTHKPMIANNTGGLSGRAIKPISVRMVHQVYSKVAKKRSIPIIGMGGIYDWRDAVEFALAGATGLSVGTALFKDPDTPNKIVTCLREYLVDCKLNSYNDLIGKLIPTT